MFGHGRPSALAPALAQIALVLCALLSSSSVAQEVAVPATSELAPAITPIGESVRFQLRWGGGDAHQWSGRVRLSQGSLSGLKLSGQNQDDAGSLWLENGQLRIAALSEHESDMVELTADGANDSRLIIELAAGPQLAPVSTQIALAELARGPFTLRLDERGGTLEIKKIEQPIVQISLKGDVQQRHTRI